MWLFYSFPLCVCVWCFLSCGSVSLSTGRETPDAANLLFTGRALLLSLLHAATILCRPPLVRSGARSSRPQLNGSLQCISVEVRHKRLAHPYWLTAGICSLRVADVFFILAGAVGRTARTSSAHVMRPADGDERCAACCNASSSRPQAPSRGVHPGFCLHQSFQRTWSSVTGSRGRRDTFRVRENTFVSPIVSPSLFLIVLETTLMRLESTRVLGCQQQRGQPPRQTCLFGAVFWLLPIAEPTCANRKRDPWLADSPIGR